MEFLKYSVSRQTKLFSPCLYSNKYLEGDAQEMQRCESSSVLMKESFKAGFASKYKTLINL